MPPVAAAPVDHAALLRERGGLGGAQQPLAVHKVLELVVALQWMEGGRGRNKHGRTARQQSQSKAVQSIHSTEGPPTIPASHCHPGPHLRQAAAQRVVAGGRVMHERQQLGPGVEGAGEQHLAATQLPAAPCECGGGLDQPANKGEGAVAGRQWMSTCFVGICNPLRQ